MQGGSGWNGIVTQTSIKKELLVSATAINPITVAINMPCNPTSLVLIYMRTNPITRHRADMPITRTIN
jgi:hypothetical protein